MPIFFSCSCGKSFRAQEGAAGKRLKCPKCGKVVVVPHPEVKAEPPTELPAEPPAAEEPRASSPARPPVLDERARGLASERYKHLTPEKPASNLLEYAYWLVLLALIPLAFNLLKARADDPIERLIRSLEKTVPETEQAAPKQKTAKQKKEVPIRIDEPLVPEVSFDALIAGLPGGKIEGAFLPRKTFVHWLFALLAAGAFLGLGLFLFPQDTGRATHLLTLAVFTATIGILLLLLAQFLANLTQGVILISRNPVILLLFWIARAIGFSYRAALDPEIGFFPSFLGFTFGVGLCEEVCKALPLLWHYRVKGTLPWRTACAWGFASGVGFGVSEGIMYSADFYNGIATGDIYLVRFTSCVALHAIWAASAALFIHKFQDLVRADFVWYEWIPRALFLVSIPMILHGLFDTFLKRDLNALALVTALVSFAWFVWSVEQTRAREESPEAPPARAGA